MKLWGSRMKWHAVVWICMALFGPACLEGALSVIGNNQYVANGAGTTSVSNGTDFGVAMVGGVPVEHVFTLTNSGSFISLTGVPIIQVAGDPGFSITLQPTLPFINAGEQTNFNVTFDPVSSGAKTGVVFIYSDEAGNSPYAFAVQGNGVMDPVTSIHVASYVTGGVVQGSVDLSWTVEGDAVGETVRIAYSINEGVTWQTVAAGIPLAQSNYSWDSTLSSDSFSAYWSVGLESDTTVVDVCDGKFAVRNVPMNFFVNDASTAGDNFCVAAGNPAFSGVSPAFPSDSIEAVFTNFSLVPGDRVYVDVGLYTNRYSMMHVYDQAEATNPVRVIGATNDCFSYSCSPSVIRTENGPLMIGPDVQGLLIESFVIEGNGGGTNASVAVYGDGIAFEEVLFADAGIGLFVAGASNQVRHSIFAENTVGVEMMTAGALYVDHATFWSNATSVSIPFDSTVYISNSIMESFVHFAWSGGARTPRGDYCVFRGSQFGNGATSLGQFQAAAGSFANSVDGDPLLYNPAGRDFHVMSLVGRYSATSDSWVVDGSHSPAIDAGDPLSPYGFEPAPNGGQLNAGCYGNTWMASLSGTGGVSTAIKVTGSGLLIANGDGNPSVTDGTSFGTVDLAGGAVDHVFTITNSGSFVNFTSSPIVQVSGSSDFSVFVQPTLPFINAGETTNFTIRLDPTIPGVQTGVVRFWTDEEGNSPYEFAISSEATGTVTAPMTVQGNGIPVFSGDNSPTSADGTDFGTVSTDAGSTQHIFSITNSGGGFVSLTGSPIVQVAGSAAFSITLQPTLPFLNPGEVTNFAVAFNPSTIGVQTGLVTIYMDEPGLPPYQFTVQGSGSGPAEPEVASILGSVFLDVNSDGILDPEDSNNIFGVSVLLSETNGTILATNLSAASAGPSSNLVSAGTAGHDAWYTTLKMVNGRPAISYRNNSTFNLQYVRALDEEGAAWGAPVLVYTNGNTGHDAEMLIVDGNPAIVFQSTDDDLMYVRALDVNGDTWGAPVAIDTNGNTGENPSMVIVDGRPAIAYRDVSQARVEYVRALDASGTAWGTPVSVLPLGLYPELRVVNGKPAVACRFSSVQVFVPALDAAGTSWGSQVMVDAGSAIVNFSVMEVINGKPSIIYYGGNQYGLRYTRAQDAGGTTWDAPLEIDTNLNTGSHASMAVIDGFPAIVYTEANSGNYNGKYIRALDADGSAWGEPQVLFSGSQNMSMLELGGNPAVSFRGLSEHGFTLKYFYISSGQESGFRFDNVSPGTYRLTEIDPGGYSSTGDSDGGAVNEITVTVTGSQVSAEHYFLDSTNPPMFTLSTTVDVNGAVSPTGPVTLSGGSSTSFLVQAAGSCYIVDVFVDGMSQGSFGPGVDSYTQFFANVQADHLLEAQFNCSPVLGFAAAPTSGNPPLRVTYDFSASSDPDNDIVLSEIDRDGDGSFEVSIPGQGSVIVEYGVPGSYTSSVQIVDFHGAVSGGSQVIEVNGVSSLSAVLERNPVSGSAPLTVSFSGTNSTYDPGYPIVVYEWDFDGDGHVDAISTNGSASYTYATPGSYFAELTVMDDRGLKAAAEAFVLVTPGANPPTVLLAATPGEGELPLKVAFTATGSDDGAIVSYAWDFTGDGVVDLVSSSNQAGYLYTAAGQYQPSVTVMDDAGLSASDTATVNVKPPACAAGDCGEQLRAWMIKPKDGAGVWGQAVTLKGNAAPGSLTASVQFQYRPAGGTNWMDIGSAQIPPKNSYQVSWDASALVDDAIYELRILAMDTASNTVYSDVISVVAEADESYAPGTTREGLVNGKHQKQQTIGANESDDVAVSDGTIAVLLAGTTESNATVEIELTGENSNPSSGSTLGLGDIAANRKVSILGDPDLRKPLTIRIPYDDVDQDGLIDGTFVRESTLEAHWYDPESGTWKRALNFVVHVDENFVQFETYHLTEFGLFGNRNILSPVNGGILASFSTEAGGAMTADNLADGNRASFWRGEDGTIFDTFLYRFSNDVTAVIGEVSLQTITNYGYPAGTFQVHVSMDGLQFDQVIFKELAYSEGVQRYLFDPVPARYVLLAFAAKDNAPDPVDVVEVNMPGDMFEDTDGDGIKDAWETYYFMDISITGQGDGDGDGVLDRDEFLFGLNPADADTDGDGTSDREEVIAGISGHAGVNEFSIREAHHVMPSAPFVFTWPSVQDRTYKVYTSRSLYGAWSNVTELIGDGSTAGYTNTSSESYRYFRLDVQHPGIP